MAMAIARREEKYVGNKAKVGQNMNPLPTPMHRPWARKSCQYVVQSEVMKTPTRRMMAPAAQTTLKYPASVARPENVPIKKRRKICTLPTQDIADGGWFSMAV
jgi:hypothetical protein